MSNLAQITNGTIKRGATIKTGDYENKRGDVEISFTVAEGTDPDAALQVVSEMANRQLADLLDMQAGQVEKSAKPKSAPKMPKAAKEEAPRAEAAKPAPAANAEMVEEPAKPKFLEDMPDPKPAPAADSLDDLLGESSDKEVTDKELVDATQQCQAANKNAPAIRKILAEHGVKQPTGRVIDMAKEKRQSYLTALKTVKPLA